MSTAGSVPFTPESKKYSFDEIKLALGDDYGFHQFKTVDEIKHILATEEMPDNQDMMFVLEVGNLDIEMIIRFGMGIISKKGIQMEPMTIGYFCCVRENGEWKSYDDINEIVNLDAPDIEVEMFRVLYKYAEEEGLSFFDENSINCGLKFPAPGATPLAPNAAEDYNCDPDEDPEDEMEI